MQLPLLRAPEPPEYPDIEIRLGSVEELLSSLSGSQDRPALIVADPPWRYQQAPGHSANPENHYTTQTELEIAQNIYRAHSIAGSKCRLALWCTFPFLELWRDAIGKQPGSFPWRYVSGGTWVKPGSPGTGYHWIGGAELVLLYVKGSGLVTRWDSPLPGNLRNYWSARSTGHSEKPVEWMERWLHRWTEPGDLVLDLYAGLAPLARACLATGRRYLGAEIDPERHREARMRLARFAGERGL